MASLSLPAHRGAHRCGGAAAHDHGRRAAAVAPAATPRRAPPPPPRPRRRSTRAGWRWRATLWRGRACGGCTAALQPRWRCLCPTRPSGGCCCVTLCMPCMLGLLPLPMATPTCSEPTCCLVPPRPVPPCRWGSYGVWQQVLWHQVDALRGAPLAHGGRDRGLCRRRRACSTGCTSAFLTNPLDVVKTRLQTAGCGGHCAARAGSGGGPSPALAGAGAVAAGRRGARSWSSGAPANVAGGGGVTCGARRGAAGFFRGVAPRMASSSIWGDHHGVQLRVAQAAVCAAGRRWRCVTARTCIGLPAHMIILLIRHPHFFHAVPTPLLDLYLAVTDILPWGRRQAAAVAAGRLAAALTCPIPAACMMCASVARMRLLLGVSRGAMTLARLGLPCGAQAAAAAQLRGPTAAAAAPMPLRGLAATPRAADERQPVAAASPPPAARRRTWSRPCGSGAEGRDPQIQQRRERLPEGQFHYYVRGAGQGANEAHATLPSLESAAAADACLPALFACLPAGDVPPWAGGGCRRGAAGQGYRR